MWKKNLQLCSLTTVHIYHLGESQAYHSIQVLGLGMVSDYTDEYLYIHAFYLQIYCQILGIERFFIFL